MSERSIGNFECSCGRDLYRTVPRSYCTQCDKTSREIELETTLSEVLAVFRDEDVTITEEMKARWLQTLNRTSSTTAN